MARPTIFSIELCEDILDIVSTSDKGIFSVLSMKDEFPCYRTFRKWIAENDELMHMYARAKENQAHYMAEQIVIASKTVLMQTRITTTSGGETDTQSITEYDAVERSRLIVDALKWTTAKLLPKIYGDKIDVTSDNKQLQGVQVYMPNNNRDKKQ